MAEHRWARANKRREVERAARHVANENWLQLSANDPAEAANKFIGLCYTDHQGLPTLRYWRKNFYIWRNATSRYEPFSPDLVKAGVYDFLHNVVEDKDATRIDRPDQAIVSKVAREIPYAADIMIEDKLEPPCWIPRFDDAGRRIVAPAAAPDLLPLRNGLFDLERRVLEKPTPQFFNLQAADFAHDENAKPRAWLKFLKSLWPKDAKSRDTLQEIMGLLLTKETKYQKMFFLLGPPAAGKSRIVSVIEELVGKANAAYPGLNDLGIEKGLEGLLGKQVAFIDDIRKKANFNSDQALTRLLTIAGDNKVQVQRKGQRAVDAKLPVRFVFTANAIPELSDETGALERRLLPVRFNISNVGREDPDLTDKLLVEIPAIFNWALEGLDRLRSRGKFESVSVNDLREFRQVWRQVKTFVDECCVVSPGQRIPCGMLYDRFVLWGKEQGIKPMDKATFARDLHHALGNKISRHEGTKQQGKYYYRGIGLSY